MGKRIPFRFDVRNVLVPYSLRVWLHRKGWLASPSAAWMGVPFGPDRRDLAAEVQAAVNRSLYELEQERAAAAEAQLPGPRPAAGAAAPERNA
jgi:hypothetical protein